MYIVHVHVHILYVVLHVHVFCVFILELHVHVLCVFILKLHVHCTCIHSGITCTCIVCIHSKITCTCILYYMYMYIVILLEFLLQLQNLSCVVRNIIIMYIITYLDTQAYVLNFHGRVTQASVKNFQLVHSADGKIEM